MPRIAYQDPSTLSPEARASLGDNPPNVSRMLAVASEPVFRSAIAFGTAFISGSTLPAKLRELAILRVGYLSDSAYELYQHEALARHIGISEAQIAAIRAGSAAALGELEGAVLGFVDDLVKNIRASDATLAAVRKGLDDRQIADLILVTGHYMTICSFLETTGVELEPEPVDWDAVMRGR